MTGLVIDASIAAAWYLDDEANAHADWVAEEIRRGLAVHAPTHWMMEIANVLFLSERRKQITKESLDLALLSVGRLPLTLHAPPPMADMKTLRLYTEKHGLTAYDAEYLRVAKERKLPLATLDRALLAAAKREKIETVG